MYKYFFYLLVSWSGISTSSYLRGNTVPRFENDPSESVSIQTDRDIYIAGETVFFNIDIFSESPEILSKICYLVLRDSRHIYNKLYIKADKENAFGSFYLPDTLQTGYYEIIGFTNYMRNFGESTYYIKNLMIVNRFDELLANLFKAKVPDSTNENIKLKDDNSPLKVILNKDSFKVREKIKMTIKLDEEKISQFTGRVTVSVKETNPFSNFLKHKYSVRQMKNIRNISSNSFFYPKESNGIYLDGIIFTHDSIPIPNECLYLSTQDTVANLQYAFSSDQGRFHFYLSDYYLGKKLIISTKEKKTENCIILMNDKFKINLPVEAVNFEITSELRKYILEGQNLVKIQKLYEINNTRSLDSLKRCSSFPYVYRNPSSIVYPSDFEHLKSFQEMNDNLIPDLKIKHIQDKFQPFVIDYSTKQYFAEPAALFFNGIPIYDLNELINYNSSDISKIELCKIQRVKGDIAFPGIVSVFSKNKTYPITNISGSIAYVMESFSKNTYFSPPQYTVNNYQDPTPDFRQLLYWNPSTHLSNGENSYEFNASDWPGEYTVEINGITKNGEPLKIYSELKIYR